MLFTLSTRAETKIPVLIVDGMNNHDWERGTKLLKATLENSGLFTVDVSTTPTNKNAPPEDWATWRPEFTKYRVIVNNFNGGDHPNDTRWPREVEQAFEDYVRNGGGVVMIHATNNAFAEWPAYNDMIGLGWRPKTFGPSLIIDDHEKVVEIPTGAGRGPGHGPEHDFQVTVLDGTHPITAGMPKKWLHPFEQLTHGQHGPAKNMQILTYAWSKDVNENEPMDWVIPYGKGRVYTTMLGHLWRGGVDSTMQCVGFQTLLIRGTEWAATGKVTYPLPANFPSANEIQLHNPVAK